MPALAAPEDYIAPTPLKMICWQAVLGVLLCVEPPYPNNLGQVKIKFVLQNKAHPFRFCSDLG